MTFSLDVVFERLTNAVLLLVASRALSPNLLLDVSVLLVLCLLRSFSGIAVSSFLLTANTLHT